MITKNYINLSIKTSYIFFKTQEVIKLVTAKEQINDILKEQPDNSSFDELLREPAFARMVDKGLSDSEAGRVVSNNEFKRKIRLWQK